MSMFNMIDKDRLRLRPASVKKTRQSDHSFLVRGTEIWNHYVGQLLVHKNLVEGKLTQQLGRSKKQTVLTLRSKLYDLSFRGEYSCRCHGKRVISAPSKPLKLKLARHIL